MLGLILRGEVIKCTITKGVVRINRRNGRGESGWLGQKVTESKEKNVGV